MIYRKLVFLIFALGLLVSFSSCSSRPAPRTLTIGVGTTLQDTGLLDDLKHRFEEETGIEIKALPKGTGQVLELARRGDVDAVWVHDPDMEAQFMAEGQGAVHRPHMHNDFVLVGPHEDPAGVWGEKSLSAAFTKIAQNEALFFSRGDRSGTNQREKELWRTAHIEPKGDWYQASGAGMATLLRMADEKLGYTLCDRGTFLTLRRQLRLELLASNDPPLINRYSVILVNPEKHPHVHYAEAERFLAFLTSPEIKKRIAEFGVDTVGEPLFHVDDP
jgi:tungstate transport system substrate-binding protein